MLFAAGPLAERDDARRPGPGGRHPGRRRDGRDREHPPQPRPGQAAAAGDSRRRHADRRADVRLDADDLHRVRVGAVPRRPAQVPVHAAGAGRGVRDAGLVPAVADARADDGRLPAAGRARGARPRQPSPACSAACTPAFERGFERFRDAYVGAAGLEPAASPGRVRASSRWSSPAGSSLLPFVGRDFFPTVDAGQFRLHVRAPAGTRLEETERYFSAGRERRSARSSRQTKSS